MLNTMPRPVVERPNVVKPFDFAAVWIGKRNQTRHQKHIMAKSRNRDSQCDAIYH